jgi:division/cell wall cluster transcriptional repressor MraZ
MARLLRGNAEGTLDMKGRATVPTKFRAMFEGKDLVLWEPQGLHQPYLLLTCDDYFDEIVEREYALAEKRDREELLRDIYGHMDDIELDSAARFVIHEKYNEKAGFERGQKLFFLAYQKYIEVWPLDVWKDREAARRQDRSMLDYTPDPVEKAIRQRAAEDTPHE